MSVARGEQDNPTANEDHQSGQRYTLDRIDDAIQLACDLSCSQGADKVVALRVLVQHAGEFTSLVSVAIEDAPDA